MAVADPAILAHDFPVSHALLVHDGLMTPKLTQFFGAVHAQQTDLELAADRIVRWSTLYQTETGTPLLRAKLVIFKTALPPSLLDRLLSGTRLFGSLVIEAGLSVRIAGHHIFQEHGPSEDASVVAWGRRHRILGASDDALLCNVEERLEAEAILQRALLPAARDSLGLC